MSEGRSIAQTTRTVRRARWAVAGVGLLALVFTAGTVVAPVLMNAGNPWGGLLRLSYAPLCHQQPERSLPIGDSFQAVCARCSGLYVGGVIGLFCGALFAVGSAGRVRPLWLLLVAVPTILDAALNGLGLPSAPNLPRLLWAWPVGFVAAWFVARGLEELLAPRAERSTAGPRTLDDHDSKWNTRLDRRGSVEVVDG